jgi:hypothetical protein
VIKPFLCVLVAGKTLLFSAKRAGVVIAPAVDDASRMFDVQHFVEEDVFDEPLRYVAGIQDLTNRNRVMGGVMMAQNASGPPPRPGQYRLFDLAVKIAAIELCEDPFEIVNLTVGRAMSEARRSLGLKAYER